ncbi:flagellar basal-body rod protein FlgG [Brevundimonas intermedia]|uniref:Flagellar basal-body rod protein FlgG n=1 Tax=Brevundimonas intermedia TaxID=74315 RepID=A0ABQ5TBH6_9CAUL|nr:flagellar hook-basal body protein [Brevundimonas intermedia]GLK50169.1 flagellar basal-body rod protein FlgG [Brevundimonas intermedia]
MNGAFSIGATGLRAQERALGITANNIANMNTPAFKRSSVRFSELMGPGGGAAGGVSALEAATVFAQGDLRVTGQPLDVAVDGEGFIEVLGADGRSLLWRGGTLSVGADGLLATADGLPLHAMIRIPEGADRLTIASDGAVAAVLAGDTTPTELGRIDLQKVDDPSELTPLGGGLYRTTGEARAAFATGEEGLGVLVQGAIEGANVALSNEMVALMLMQRAYAASAQALQAGDQLMAIANGLRR